MPGTLIVDDDSDMRFLIRMTIEVANEGLYVCGEAESGAAALAAVATDRPEVVVLDNWMPGMSGLETARQILSANPDQRIVLFSANLDPATLAEASALGVTVCLSKTEIEQLPDALRQASAGA